MARKVSSKWHLISWGTFWGWQWPCCFRNLGKSSRCVTGQAKLRSWRRFVVPCSPFCKIQISVKGDVSPTREAMDELMVMCFLAIQAETSLRASISTTVSCTDASPTGGGSCIATRFKDTGFDIPAKVPEVNKCGDCGADFKEREEHRKYPCPRNCGAKFCKLACAWRHNEECVRKEFFAPKFGERFCGKNYPLSKALGLQGIAVQEPLDRLRKGAEWEFFSDEGKTKLDGLENEASLCLGHWAPNCRTFSRARGRPIWPKGRGKGKGKKGKIAGPKAVRSNEEPWGISRMSKDDAIKVRQDNKMAQRSLRASRKGTQLEDLWAWSIPGAPTSGPRMRLRPWWNIRNSMWQSTHIVVLVESVSSGQGCCATWKRCTSPSILLSARVILTCYLMKSIKMMMGISASTQQKKLNIPGNFAKDMRPLPRQSWSKPYQHRWEFLN